MGTGDYESAGVKVQTEALDAVARFLGPTFSYPEGVKVLTSFGHYASVIEVADDLAIAFCTDGVGSKTVIASMLDRYDTVGFDCVAMNVNDLICIGAHPIAMVDYLGVHTLDPARTEPLLAGLGAAAREAGIAIPGGEIAQLPDVIGSDGRGPGDARAFDLVGACIGLLRPDRMILGAAMSPGDVLIGLHSSGLHSNGYTLARRVLLTDAGSSLDASVRGLTRSLGEELLEPTRIYARAVKALWGAEVATHGLAHITGDGFLNLARLDAPVGYEIDELPDVPPIFGVIQEAGSVPDAEMYRVFNMGIGLVVAVPPTDAPRALEVLGGAGYPATRIGRVTDETGVVRIRPAGLWGSLEREAFESE